MYLLVCIFPVMLGLFLSCFETLVYCSESRPDLPIEELLKLQVPDLIIGPMIQILLQFLNGSVD